MPAPDRLRVGLLVLYVSLGACSDNGPVVPEQESVVRLELDRDAVELELRDSVQLTVTAFAASGTALQGASVGWASSDPAVARVSAAGLVAGLTPGTATVTVSADGATARATITVLDYNVADNLTVIDSVALDLVSDSAERATGTYRFRVLRPPAPAFTVGTVIVGTEDLGFLRRITAVATEGDVVTLQTEQAALSDVVEEGSLDTSIDLIFSAGAPSLVGPVAPGEVRWGQATFTPLIPGAALTAAGVSLSGLDVCKLLKEQGGTSCPAGISKLEIKTGTLDFGPTFDLKAAWTNLSLSSFEGVASGTVVADFDVVLEAKTSTTPIKPQIDIAEITRPFYAQLGPVPVIGYVELALKGGLEAKATAKGTVEAGFTNSHTVKVGASWSDGGGWSPVFDSQRSFDAKLPSLADGTLSGQIDVETKLFLKPELRIIFYGVVGPFVNVEPYGKFSLTFGTSACGMKSEAGINSEIGFTIPFLDPKVGTLSKKNEPWFSWPGRDWDCPLGTLDVSTITNGQSPDPDGYSIVVDSTNKGTVGSNAQSTLSFIEVGQRSVLLEGVASNCVVQGDNPAQVMVNTGLVTPVPFQIECADPGGDLDVRVRTSGQNLDPDGYRITVDRSQSKDVGPDGTVTFSGLGTGDHEVALAGLSPNCVVVGPNPRFVSVPSGGTVTASFDIECSASQLVVQTQTSGPPATTNWSVSVDGATQAIGPNGQATFDVAPGSYPVELSGVAANCSVQGANPRSVTVAGSQVTELFLVGCAGAGITVTVTTQGDPAPAASYTVQVDTVKKTIATNGGVDFQDVAEGSHSVGLLDVPAHCLVQGQNPRSVDAPGSAAFEVVCQQPTACLNPPDGVRLESKVVEEWDKTEPQPTMTHVISKAEYGDMDVMAALSDMAGNQSASSHAQVVWEDWWKFLPVDQTRLGETVTMKLRVSGVIQRQSDPDGRSSAYFNGMGLVRQITGSDSSTGSVIDEPVDLQVTLGNWEGAAGWVAAFAASSHPGTTPSARAAQRVQVVDIVDASGLSVPIVQMCTASGVDYR